MYSRFRLADLHVHTLVDQHHAYGDWGTRDPDESFASELVKNFKERNVEVIAVTDHNQVDWYPILRQAGDAAGVYVFPGLEISVNGCHLLAVWDRTDAGFALAERFVETLWKPGEERFEANGDPRPVTSGQVLDISDQARKHGALVFAPHSTAKDMGLFAKGVCSNSSEIAQSGMVVGFDVYGHTGADVLRNPRSEFGNVPPRWFISGDIRSIEQIGARATYLKLDAQPTLEGLRQAFLMSETRVRFPQSLYDTWSHVQGVRFLEDPAPAWPRVTSVRIDGGFHDGLDIQIAPGLTAIIGGKGTGKSTFIEVLRYVLNSEEPSEADGLANRKHNFRANAEAIVGFVDGSGDEYEIIRSGDESPARLLRAGRDTEVAVSRRVSVRVFGQRELQALASDHDLLREFVASQAGPTWEQESDAERGVMDSLGAQNSELEALEADLERMTEDEAELADARDKLTLAEERGVADLIKSSEELGQVDRKLGAVLEWPQRVASRVNELAAELPPPDLPVHPSVPSGLDEANKALAANIESSADELKTKAGELETRHAETKESWNATYGEMRSAIQKQLSEAGIENPQELDLLQQRAATLEAALEALPEKRLRHSDLVQARTRELQQLGEVRRRKSRLVEDASRALTELVGSHVRVVATPMGDRTGLLRVLEDAVRGQQVRREQLERLAKTAPGVLVAAIRIGARETEELGCTPATAGKLAALAPEMLRAFEEIDTPDDVTVEIDLGPEGAEAWTSIEDVSPGQRATALLALALAGGSEPLVIDQPEDDLDNRYIYNEVVKVLQRVCESRQVIVATHNANIPILGDAEIVLALDAAADRSSVLACGGLEDPMVAENARTILEGGDEAFRARHERYLAVER